MQFNVCGLLARQNEFKHFLTGMISTPDVICIQESFLKPHKQFKLDNYNIVRKDRSNQEKGGVVTLIKCSMNYKVLPTPDEYECIAVEVIINNTVYTIVNVYISPSQDINPASFSELFRFKNAIVTGDMNSHNPLWKSPSLNRRGRLLKAFLMILTFQ